MFRKDSIGIEAEFSIEHLKLLLIGLKYPIINNTKN